MHQAALRAGEVEGVLLTDRSAGPDLVLTPFAEERLAIVTPNGESTRSPAHSAIGIAKWWEVIRGPLLR